MLNLLGLPVSSFVCNLFITYSCYFLLCYSQHIYPVFSYFFSSDTRSLCCAHLYCFYIFIICYIFLLCATHEHCIFVILTLSLCFVLYVLISFDIITVCVICIVIYYFILFVSFAAAHLCFIL